VRVQSQSWVGKMKIPTWLNVLCAGNWLFPVDKLWLTPAAKSFYWLLWVLSFYGQEDYTSKHEHLSCWLC
jgi:hypothetical protein